MNAITRTPTHTMSAWSENGRPRRTWATIQPTRAATMMAMPPIVGVPCLAMWCSGPRSSLPRIGWPSPRVRNAEIRKRVTISDRTPADDAGDHDGDHDERPPSSSRTTSRSSNAHDVVADRLRRLVALAGDDHDVAAAAPRRAPARSPRARSGSTTHLVPIGGVDPAQHGVDDGAGPPNAGCQMSRRRGRRGARRPRPSRPLGVVAVAAGAEHDDDPPAGRPAGGQR